MWHNWLGHGALLFLTAGVWLCFGLLLRGSARKNFVVGVLAAAGAAGALLVVQITMSKLGSPLRPSTQTLFLAPAFEEGLKAWCVFVLSLRLDWRSAISFAIGYATVESTFNLVRALGGLGDDSLWSAVEALYHVSLAPFAVLVALALLMCALKVGGAPAPGAVVLCFLLHSGYNLFGALQVATDSASDSFVAVRAFAAFLVSLFLLLFLARTTREPV